jgi:hypothetical protein
MSKLKQWLKNHQNISTPSNRGINNYLPLVGEA